MHAALKRLPPAGSHKHVKGRLHKARVLVDDPRHVTPAVLHVTLDAPR
jgi:hypothetical protein